MDGLRDFGFDEFLYFVARFWGCWCEDSLAVIDDDDVVFVEGLCLGGHHDVWVTGAWSADETDDDAVTEGVEVDCITGFDVDGECAGDSVVEDDFVIVNLVGFAIAAVDDHSLLQISIARFSSHVVPRLSMARICSDGLKTT